jgi:hypothetical protein
MIGEYVAIILMCALTSDPVPRRLAGADRGRAVHDWPATGQSWFWP